MLLITTAKNAAYVRAGGKRQESTRSPFWTVTKIQQSVSITITHWSALLQITSFKSKNSAWLIYFLSGSSIHILKNIKHIIPYSPIENDKSETIGEMIWYTQYP